MIDLNLLYIFYKVGKCGSVSKASKELYISQPAVSQNIKTLEERINIVLFKRESKGVKLTNEAMEIYEQCKKIFNEVDLLEKKIDGIKNLDTGTLRIGASDTICKYFLIDKLRSYEKAHPNIRYRVTNCTTKKSLELLNNNDVDIAFIHTSITNNPIYHKCLELEDVFVCSYDFDDSKIKNLNDLMNYRILLLEEESYSRKMLDKNLIKYGITLKPKFELASLDLLIEFCKNNMGIICVAKEYIKKELENKELKIININEKLDKRYISLVANNKYISNAANSFIEHVKND